MYFDGKRTFNVKVQMKEQTERKPTAIGLMRVSTALQEAEGYSLEAQQKEIERYCANNGYELLDTYSEQASGRKQDREVVNEVLKRCRSTKSTLIIARLDRFTRDLHFLTKVQKIRGFNFIALDNPNADAMVIQIMMSVAENESRMISVRTKTALKIAKANGVELGNHKSILATYSRLEKDKKLCLTRDNENLWETFCLWRSVWNDNVINHKNYKLFRKYIDPVYEVVDTGLGWEEYIKRTVFEIEGEEWGGDEMSFWDEYQRIYKPEELIGQRYKGGTFDMNAFGDMCEDAFLFQPLSYYGLDNTLKDHRISNSVAFQLPQLDMTASKKSIKETKKEVEAQKKIKDLHQRTYFRRFTHKAEMEFQGCLYTKKGVKFRAYDIGRLWTQLMRDNTKSATIKRIELAREEAQDIYIPAIEEARAKGITGIRPLARYLTEQRIFTPKGNENWSPSSVQSILRLEKDINNDEPLEGENDFDITSDLAMTLTFNQYAMGVARNGEELPIRDKETGHITRPIDLSNLDETIASFKEMIDDGSYKKMTGKELDITSFIELRSKNIDKEPLFDNPIPRI
jgi:DNA invertase Pin-like site-specific DNA recombinase